MAFLDVKNLSGGYGGEDICKKISFELEKGEVLSVLGPNGCGKTTFFRLLLGFNRATTGEIFIDNLNISKLSRKETAKKIAYIPQYHTPNFSYTVLDVVLMGRSSYISAYSSPTEEDIKEALKALNILGILNLADNSFKLLSGGQRQLVLIARAICQNANILVMDEPGASLDYSNHQLLMQTIKKLSENGYTIIMSTHSPEHPFSVADKVLLMKSGEVVSFGKTKDAVTTDILREVYGVEMDIIFLTDSLGVQRTICLPLNQKIS